MAISTVPGMPGLRPPKPRLRDKLVPPIGNQPPSPGGTGGGVKPDYAATGAGRGITNFLPDPSTGIGIGSQPPSPGGTGGGLALGNQPPSPGGTGLGGTAGGVTSSPAGGAANFWNAERMRNAQPMNPTIPGGGVGLPAGPSAAISPRIPTPPQQPNRAGGRLPQAQGANDMSRPSDSLSERVRNRRPRETLFPPGYSAAEYNAAVTPGRPWHQERLNRYHQMWGSEAGGTLGAARDLARERGWDAVPFGVPNYLSEDEWRGRYPQGGGTPMTAPQTNGNSTPQERANIWNPRGGDITPDSNMQQWQSNLPGQGMAGQGSPYDTRPIMEMIQGSPYGGELMRLIMQLFGRGGGLIA